MTRSKHVRRGVGKLSKCGTVGIVSLVLLLGSGSAWAGPPNRTPSDVHFNTAGGLAALLRNTTGFNNSAFGALALYRNTTAYGNSAFGAEALSRNTTAYRNSAFGAEALLQNNSGADNSAFGYLALNKNDSGGGNTAIGYGALFNNTAGISNVAIGINAGGENTNGIRNTFIGPNADAFAPNAGSFTNGTAIGNSATLFASNSIVLGNDQISAIYANVTTITGISDRRRKKDIRVLDADLGLDFVKKLQPVSYRFNNGDETERYGFIAQDLEQALPVPLHDTIERSEPEHGLALIERQNDGDRTYHVAYGELLAPIVKAIQQQQQAIEAERQQNADLRHALAAVANQVAALTAQNDALQYSIAALREQVTAAR